MATKLPLAGGTLTGALIGTSATFTPSSGESVVITRDSGGPYLGTSTNHSLRLITNNASRVNIASGGDVSFGTSGKFFWNASAECLSIGVDGGSNDRRFEISSTSPSTATTQFGIVANPTYPTNVTGTVYNLYSQPNVASGTTLNTLINLYLGASGLNSSTVTNNYGLYQAGGSEKNYFAGNVGIGTTTPTMPLSVQAASNAYAISMHGRSDGYSELYGASYDGSTKYSFLQSHSAQTKLYTLVNTPLLFGTNSTERMRIDASGNVDLYQGSNLTWRYAAGSTIQRKHKH